jgi:phospholipid transport system substrate-binding protein
MWLLYMQGRFKVNILKSMLLAVMLGVAAPAMLIAAELTAVESAELSVNELLAKVETLKPYFNSDRERYFAGIEESLSLFVDFDEVAIGVMARYAAQASPVQISRFGDKLKLTLTRFYGSALIGYNGEELIFLPAGQPSPDPEANTNVRMRVGTSDSPVELQYTLFMNEDREWKLKNLFVGGINLRRQYFTQFSALMNRYGNDIDQVIDNWQ